MILLQAGRLLSFERVSQRVALHLLMARFMMTESLQDVLISGSVILAHGLLVVDPVLFGHCNILPILA